MVINFNFLKSSLLILIFWALGVSVVVGAPSLQLEQPAGVTLSASGQTVSFFKRFLGESDTALFIVRNKGDQNLNISSVSISGANAECFSVVETCQSSIAAGGVGFLRLLFNPKQVGVLSASLSLTSNASNQSSVTINLQGTGLAKTNVIRYVRSASTGSNNGSSWSNAYTQLNQAITAANSGDEIWVAQGTYKPSTIGDRSASFLVKPGVAILGGFAGTETHASQRNYKANLCILSGDLIGNDSPTNFKYDEPTRSDNSSHVFSTAGDVVDPFRLDGFIVESGNADGTLAHYGGGMYFGFTTQSASNVTIANTVLKRNSCVFDGAAAFNNGNVKFFHCVFESNRAGSSGAAVSTGDNTAPVFAGCVFWGNEITHNGTAYPSVIYCGDTYSRPEITNCTLANNKCLLVAAAWATPILRNNIIWGNTPIPSLVVDASYLNATSPAVIQNNLIEGGYSGNNSNVDPIFISMAVPMGADGKWGTADDGLRLSSSSPAVNAGLTSAASAQLSLDITGSPRTSGLAVDLGAYEYGPSIVEQPQLLSVTQNSAASFSVSANGAGSLSYQWQKDGVDIPGATTSSFSLSSAQPWHIGDYTVKVTDSVGTVTSKIATLSINGVDSGIWKGLVAYYPFNGSTMDESINAIATANYGGVISTNRFALAAKAISFNGSNNRIEMANSPLFAPSQGTVCIWLKAYSLQTSDGYIDLIAKDRPGDRQWIIQVKPNGILRTALFTNAGEFTTDSVNAIASNTWVHLVMVWDESYQKGFINGSSVSTMPITGSVSSGSSPVTIAGVPDYGTSLNGVVDDVRIYNRALSASEVQALYASEATVPPVLSTPSASQISTTSATLGGDVTADGGAAITERGVVYSASTTNADPLIGGAGVTKLTAIGTTDVFTVPVTGLTQGTNYSYKAYATNSQGTSYTSVGTFATLSTSTEFYVTGWGINEANDGKINTPQGLSGVIHVDGSRPGTIALLANGTVVQWGAWSQSPPANLSSVIEIDAGWGWALARLADGSLRCWGANDSGQISGIPTGNDYIQIAVGNMHGLALKSDGTIVGWGRNDFGQASIPAGLNNVIAISAHGHNSLALKSDGTVVGWGAESAINNVPSGLTNVQRIACGDTFALALKADGSVVAWGSNNVGQTNVPAGLNEVVKVFAEGYTAYAIRKNGSAVVWGYKSADYLKVPDLPAGYAWHTIGGGWEHMYGLARQIGPADVTTPLANTITATGAALGGNVTSEGQSAITERGVVYSITATNADPLIDGAGVTKLTASGTTGVFTVPVTGLAQGISYSFKAYAINNQGTSYTSLGTFTTLSTTIHLHPLSQTVSETAPVTFTVTASGVGALSYQWQKDGVGIPGAISSSLSLSSAKPWHIGDYTVKVTDSVGAVTSDVATLSLNGVNSGIWKGLVAYFPFNDGVTDLTLNNHQSENYGASAAENRFGKAESARYFDGNSYIQTNIESNSFPLTISVWFSASQSLSRGSLVDSDVEGQYGNSLILGYQNTRTLDVQFHDGYQLSNWALTDDKWHHGVVSIEEDLIKIYVDGVIVNEWPYSLGNVNGSLFRFGRHNSNLPLFFLGLMDDIRIYNRSLSASEVQALFASEATISPILLMPTSAQISATGATLGGDVTSEGQSAITERGVVYSATVSNADPLIGGTGVTKLTAIGTTGVFTVPVTGLTQGTSYSFKAYALNSQGTSYTSVGAFTTLSNNADLSALILSSGTLSPSFASDTTAYSAGVSNSMSSITVTPSLAQANATIEVRVNAGTYAAVTSASETLALNVGINTVDVRVTAQDGVTQKAYSVTVTRAAINPSYINGSEVPVTSNAYTATGDALGTVTLGAAAAPGQVFTLVNNTGASPIIGTFTGLAEGATLSATFGGDTFIFRISYVGGDGNDITLTRVGGEGQIGNSSHVYDWSLIAGKHGEAGSADGVGMNARFSAPSGVTVDSTGNLFVVDGDNHTIRKITVAGSVSTFAGTLGIRGSTDGMGTAARFDAPFGITCDSSDNLYVADQGNSCIRRISPQGDVSTVTASVGQLSWGPQGVAVDLQGNLYITDTNGQRICKISPQTGFSVLAGGGAGQAGSADGTGTAARFSSPSGITVDTNGNVYVADHGNHLLRKISPAGVVTTLAGSPGQANSVDGVGSAARLYYPTGISVDPSGDLFLCGFDGSVRRISPSGVVTTVGGLAQQGGTTNGVGSVARFISSFGVACGRYGELYVVEWLYGHVVRKGAPMGFKPLVSLEAATVAGVVTLHGTVNPNGFVTNAMFEYGKTQTLGNEVALSLGSNASTSSQAVSAQLSLLESGSTYYYRLTASNVDGSTLSDLGTFTTLSTNPDLSALTLSSGTLSPAFASVTTDYTAGVSGAATSITMTPTAAQANATIDARVNGGTYASVTSGSASATLALNVGANIVDVRVTAQDGVTQKIYSVTVTRANPIQNLVVAQRAGTRLIDLTYDLDAAAPVKITLEISSDGGQTYFVPAYTLTGDVGLNVAAGNGKTMTWDAGTDWLGNRSDQMRFRLVADDLSDGFSYIPSGPFTMGRTSGDTDSDAPPVSVRVSRFELQTTETTKAQWDSVRAWAVNNGYTDLVVGAGKATNHPVQTVNWWDVVKWCNARSEREGLTPCYRLLGAVMRIGTGLPECDWTANGYRLPTEAEWERAARGGNNSKRYPWGSDVISHFRANYNGSSNEFGNASTGYHPSFNVGELPYTSPVGSFSANSYGLMDMSGNIIEWCWDWYGDDYYSNGRIEPRGPASGVHRVLRGGSWISEAVLSRCSQRDAVFPPSSRYNFYGFRTARNAFSETVVSPFCAVDARLAQSIEFTHQESRSTTDNVILFANGGGSSNPVTFAVTSGPGVITNNVLTFTTSGSVTITASQVGNDNYLAAPDVSRTFNVTKAMATVTLGSLAQTFNNTPLAATATTEPSVKTVIFTYDGSSTAPTNAGSYQVVGAINDPIYQGSATGTLVIGKSSQVITFATITDKLTADSVNLFATGGGSNNPVTFAVTSGPAVITNKVLTFTTSGSVTITASQIGNDNYIASSDVIRTFNVDKTMATVTLGSLAQTFNNTPRVATATTEPVELNVEFTYAGSTTPPTNAGSYEVVGAINDPIYQGSATGTLVIGKSSQVITFAAIPNKLSTESVTLSASGSGSNIPVTFAVTSGPGIIANNVLTFTTSGTVTITASQIGNDNYLAAPDVSRTFNVTKAMATVTLGSLVQTFNNTPRAATATTTPADLNVEFTYAGSTTPPTNAGSYEVVGTINDLIYQGTATGTLVIGKNSQTITFAAIADKLATDSVNLAATGGGSGNPVTFAVTSGPGVITNNLLTFTTSGSVTVKASQSGNDNYVAAPEVSRTFNVTKSMATVTLGSVVQTFNNTPRVATATTTPADLSVEFTYAGSTTPPTNAGSYEVVGTINDLIYQGSASGTLVIGKESQTITFAVIPDKLTTDSVNLAATGGGSNTPVTFAVTSGPAVITNNVLTFTTSGSVTITASQVGNDNYLAAPEVSRTFNVTKAMATITLGSLAQTFNNTPRVATATTAPLGLVVEFTYDGSSTAPTVAGTYAVIGTINDPMYQGSATGTLVISKSSQVITFAAITDKLTTDSVNLAATGGGSNIPVTFVVTSGPAAITNNVLNFTTSGSVTITASQVGNDNYLAAPDVSRTFNVTKAMATVTLGSLAQTFDNTPRVATATTEPSGKNVIFTYDGSSTAPTNAGSYQVVGAINDPIYQGSATGTLVIGKSSQVITFAAITDKLTTDSVNLAATGGGSNIPVTFAVTSGPGIIANNVLSFTTSGSVTITASQAGNDNYLAAPDVIRTFNVTKAMATVTLGSLAQTFNNTPLAATSTTAPLGLVVEFTYDGSSTVPTVAGTYAVVGTINDPMYQGSATGSLVIGKAAQSITFAAITDKLTTNSINLSATGGGSNNPVTFAVTSGPGVITNNVLTFTTSGSVTVKASQSGNDNYVVAPEVSRTFNVTKATATVTLGSLAQTFNNTPRIATATTEPSGKTVIFTYEGSSAAPTNAGSYQVVGAINDPIYQGSATGTLVISKSSQVITFVAITDKLTTDSVNLSATGGGSNNPVTFAVTSGPAVITNNVLTFTTSGSVTITASQIGNDNYLAAPDVSRTFNVTKTMATVTLGSLAQTFNNTPRAATATTEPSGKTVIFTYEGSSTAPTNAGSYEVVGTVNDLIYQGTATGTLVIGKNSQTITFAAIPDKLTTDSMTLAATGGGSNNPVTFAVTSGPGVITNNVLTFTSSGSVTVKASQSGNDNYVVAPDVSRTFNVTKAAATVTLGSLAQTFNNTPRAITATTAPLGLVVEFTYDGSSFAPTVAGTYAVVGTINDAMYQGSASGSLEIGKAAQVITFAAIADKLTTDSVTLSATGGGSNNPVTFAVTSGPGLITNNVLTFTTSGSVTITASQVGNNNYLAAPDVLRTFNVTKTTATVTLGSLAQTFNDTPRVATANTEPAPLAVGLTYNGSSTAPTNAGSYEVVATVNDLIYQGSATGTLVIGKDSQTIAFAAIADKLTTDSVNLTATGGGSNNPVTFAVTSGPAAITNNVLTFKTSGSVTVTASQVGNADYLAAEAVSRSFTVTKTEAPITLAQLTQVANGTPRPVTVSTTPADLTVNTLYVGSATAPSLPGSYAVTSTIESLLYQGTASGTLTVLGLSGLEQPILSGSTVPATNNGTDYGNVTLGRVLTRVFTLLNPGSQPVALSGNPLVEVEGAHTGDFQVSVLPETVIPAGGSVAFEVRFAPTQPGLRTAQVKLVSAAIANGPITFAVQGFGSLPAPRAQTIAFAPPATVYLSQPSLQLTATSSSGLPVTLQVISGPATLGQNGVLNLASAGTVKVEARQAGNGSFAPAPALLRTITVKADPTMLTLVDLIKTYNGQAQEAGIVGAADFDVDVTYRVGSTYREEPPVNAGQYPVKAVAGSVTKTGTLIINPAPLYVNVEDKRRLVGEDNPALTVFFEGFIGADTLASVLSKPINLATTASKTSPVGSYAITSSGGAVTTNYKLVHRPGTLVVEGVAGSYEALVKNPESGLPNGHLALTVPAASRTFTASLRLGQESAAIAYSGNLTLSAQSRLASATLSKTVAGVAYELKVVLSMFGELNVEVRRAGVLVAEADDGIRLLTLPTGQKSAQEGSYTAILEPALPAGQAVPVGAGWATVKVDATGKMTLTGKLADGTAFTTGVAADVAEKPGYRFFVQTYATLRKDSYVGGSFTLVPHPRLAGKSYVAGSNLTWVKAGQLKDLSYRAGFGPVTSTLRIDPWQAPTTTNRLPARLELGVDGRWQVEHSNTGSLSHVALPTLVGVNATNVVSVVAPLANTRKWKLTITPTTGAYTGSFELQELTEARIVNFSGVLRQTPTLTDDLIGAGHYLLPALKAAPSTEQTSGAMLFWRPE